MRFLPLFAAIFAITPLAIDMYLPALPRMAITLESSIEIIQNSLSIYLAGYGLGMFLFGPLADRLGRRPLLMGGLIGFTLFTWLLSNVDDVTLFLVFRFLQALFGGAATVVIPGAIRQLFGKDTAKGLSYVSMIMMIAPMLAPAVGGYLLSFGQWPLIFKVLAAYSGIILIISFFFFPKLEVKKVDSAELPLKFLASYKKVLGTSSCHGYLLISMLSSVVFFTYITSVSFLYIQVFQLSEQQFSLLFGLNVVGLFVSNFFNTRLVPHFGSNKILFVASLLALVATLIFFALMLTNAHPYIIVSGLILLIAAVAMISANSDALVLQQFSEQAGTATAVIGTLRFGSGAIAGPLLAVLFDGSGLPIAYIILVSVIIVNLAVWLLRDNSQSDRVNCLN
ncbi:multidrug effflux MFS transporter [Aliikangiella sp. IMCC44359]|uniref:multidrug effflux MFS transporter n=1 Tax=Aliikangiella sp. IMCC44359 TaxID=3459125 RepID=UPI00403AE987